MNFKFKLSQRLARMRIAAAIGVPLALGCGITSAGPVVDRVEQLHINPGRIALMPYQSANLNLLVVTGHGNPPDLGTLRWSATGGTISPVGLVGDTLRMVYTSPAQPGSYKLIITTQTSTPADTAAITVTATAIPVNAVAVSPGSVSLAAGDTATLRTTLTDTSGNVLFGRAIDWTSSDGGVATVLASGFVRAIAAGTATITASTEGHSGSAAVTVKP
ncbi:MAG TPA: Ig-like domain-containing protein [Gemmatimonadales bacterium]|nr:Ig-like domain-containing protein [Gemmatimonadales bacterium]